MNTCKVLVPAGVLGAGIDDQEMDRAMSLRPDAIAIDGGSTDSGPYYLGRGVSKMTEKATSSDIAKMLRLQQALKIPVLIGSSGTCGTDAMVDWVAGICRRIAVETNYKIKIALIYTEQSQESIKEYLGRGRIVALPPAGNLDEASVDRCNHIVAVAGHEPYVEALLNGADVVIGGRTTDTAIISAVPLLNGLPPGPTWHAAKVSECGALVADKARRAGAVMVYIDETGFEVEPLEDGLRCTPQSVAAHLLYENANPYELIEPGVVLDTRAATYSQVSDSVVRVEGSTCRQTPYTLKLEGAGKVGYRTMMFVGIAQPDVLTSIEVWLDNLRDFLEVGIQKILGYGPEDYLLDVRAYGWDVLHKPPTGFVPNEVGLMVLVTADRQCKASEIIKYCNPYVLHFSHDRSSTFPSFAFPYSPPDAELGAVYEFQLQHVVLVDDPLELTRIDWIET